jgi:hypothetical protein
LAKQAGGLAQKKDFEPALRLLEQAAQLVRQSLSGPAPEVKSESSPKGIVAFQKLRLAWVEARNRVHGELEKLKAAIIREYEDEEEFDPEDLADATQKVTQLDQILENLDESLKDKLDEVLVETDPDKKRRLQQEAQQIMSGYRRYVDSDPLVAVVDDNEFLPVTVKKTMTGVLSAMEKALG